MFKKYKQLIIGFILGALVFGIIPVSAVVQDYILKKSETKLMVDGKEFANKELPVLIYKGYNYIPAATFREICDTIGVGFEWVGEKNEIQINTNRSMTIKETKVKDMIDIEKDGYKLFVVDGVEYILPREIFEKHIDQGYDFRFIPETKELYFYHTNNLRNGDEEILLRNIETHIFQNKSYIEYNYFKENILPLIK